MVEYEYKVWGNPITVTGEMVEKLGKLNPFRYRGYVWDEETGLYYLRSRYYCPQWGRFLNADTLLGKVGGLLSHNLFTYAINNPITFGDEDGQFFGALVGGIFGGIVGFVTTLLDGGGVEEAGINALSGAVNGAICGLGIDLAVATGGLAAPLIAAGFGLASSFADETIQAGFHEREFDFESALTNGCINAGANLLGYGVTGAVGGIMKRSDGILNNMVEIWKGGTLGRFPSATIGAYTGILDGTVAYTGQMMYKGANKRSVKKAASRRSHQVTKRMSVVAIRM